MKISLTVLWRINNAVSSQHSFIFGGDTTSPSNVHNNKMEILYITKGISFDMPHFCIEFFIIFIFISK